MYLIFLTIFAVTMVKHKSGCVIFFQKKKKKKKNNVASVTEALGRQEISLMPSASG
jgi:hypothetical protein